jgi:hypothetical protein
MKVGRGFSAWFVDANGDFQQVATMLDDDEVKVIDDIKKYGWHAIHVDKDHAGPGFAYSVGLMDGLKHPEIIIFGLRRQLMHDMLWGIFREVQSGKNFSEGKHEDVLEGYACDFRIVHEEQHQLYLGYAMWHCRYRGSIGSLRALQCTWPDKSGLFPFEKGCNDEVRRRQPLLYEQPLKI